MAWSFDSETTSHDYSVPLVLMGRDMGMASLIEAFSFSSDHTRVIASYVDRSARVWNLETGAMRLVRGPAPKENSVQFAALLEDGTAVLADTSGRLLVFSNATGTAAPAASASVGQLSYLAALEGSRALIVSKSGQASVVDLSNKTQPQLQPLEQLRSCSAAAAASDLALCLDKDGGLRVVRASDGKLLFDKRPRGPAKFISAYVPRAGNLIAASDSKGSLTITSLGDGATVAELQLSIHLSGDDLLTAAKSPLLSDADRAKIAAGATSLDIPAGANSIKLSPDASHVAVAMPDRTVHIIDIRSGKSLELAGNRSQFAIDLDFSPNGKLLAVVEQGQYLSLKIFESATGHRLADIGISKQSSPRVTHLVNGRGFATVGKDGHILVHPVFENTQDLIAYLGRKFPEGLTPAQRRAYFIE